MVKARIKLADLRLSILILWQVDRRSTAVNDLTKIFIHQVVIEEKPKEI